MSQELLSFFLWYLAAGAAGLLALPLAFRFFRHLPDRGYSFTKPLGLLVWGYLFWLLGSLGITQNNTGSILLAGALTGGLGLVYLGRGGLPELRRWLSAERGSLLVIEAVFLAAFALWAVVRAYNPNIEGTEKPMEFMFINSVLRSPTFPPQDAWLSGHAISYYYFGYVLIAMLTRLTATDPAVAFNLGMALLFGLTASASLGAAANLIGLARRAAAPLTRSLAPALLAPVLVLVIGNYYGFLDLAHSNGLWRETRLPAVWYDFGQAPPQVQPQTLAEFERPPGIRAGMIGLWEWLDLKQLNYPPPPARGPWRWELGRWFFAARVVHDRTLTGSEVEAIDENPAFSFLLADMHPHVLALPFVILAGGMALEWLVWARRRLAGAAAALEGDPAWGRELLRAALPRLLLSAVILGGLAFLNTWDFPIYLFLTVLAALAGAAAAGGWAFLQKNLFNAAALVLGLAALSVLLYLPFYFTLQSQAGGILPNLIFPTRFQQTVVNFGPVMAGVTLFLAWAARRWWPAFDRRAALWAGAGITLLLAVPVLASGLLAPLAAQTAPALARFVYPLSLQEASGLFLQRRLVDSLAALYPALVIGLAVGLAVGLMCRPARAESGPDDQERDAGEQAAVLMALVLIVTGALLLLGPEYVYLRDFFGTRMNTLFKFYFQVWTLWAIAGTFGLWYVWENARSRAGRIGVGLAVLAILPGLVYLPGSLLAKTGSFAGPPTLDGLAYFARSSADDYAAIRWLQENVEGAPVILEGTRGSYWMEGRSSRISMATGLPTLLGWRGHEHQWRGDYFSRVAEREVHIQQIYQERSWGAARALLDAYQVEYVIVGGLERSWYTPLYQPKFDIHLEKVFESPGTVIYRYRR